MTPTAPPAAISTGTRTVPEPTTVHCPDCGTRVDAGPDVEAVACPSCRTAFAPWGLPTAAPRASSTPPDPLPAHGAGAEDLAGQTVAGRRLVRVIGRGGMGTVYEAEDRRRGRVAVKVLPEALARDPHFVARFHREAKVLAGLSHPHLVEVYERGQDGPRCWFVMEHVRGESLRRRIERGPLPWRDALRVAREVLAGLGYAHGRGVVHRDLKPENVLFDDAGRARLLDFGLSRIVRGEAAEDLSRLTRTNVILGTYEYMAPEQRLGKSVDERADLYALGVILYEMLTGALPLGRFEAASVLRPGVPAALDPIIHRALAPAPKDRFPSAVAFLEALAACERDVAASPAPAARTNPPPPVALGNAHAEPRPLPDGLDRVRRHVDWIATGNRLVAVLAMLVAAPFAMFSVITLGLALPFALGFGLGGYFLFGLANRLQRYERGARDTQVLAAVLMCVFLPPVGWIVGIPSFLVLLSRDGRALFDGRGTDVGRARHLNPSFFASWREQARAPAPARRPHGARHLAGHALVVFSVAVLATTSLLLLSPTFRLSGAVSGEESLGLGVIVATIFTALWFLIGGRRTLLVTLVAAAVVALVARHDARRDENVERARFARPASVHPAPIPLLDDRGRGRGRTDR